MKRKLKKVVPVHRCSVCTALYSLETDQAQFHEWGHIEVSPFYSNVFLAWGRA